MDNKKFLDVIRRVSTLFKVARECQAIDVYVYDKFALDVLSNIWLFFDGKCTNRMIKDLAEKLLFYMDILPECMESEEIESALVMIHQSISVNI